jgi:hypothetical protein
MLALVSNGFEWQREPFVQDPAEWDPSCVLRERGPYRAHYLGLIPATNCPVSVHADVPAGVRLSHANLLWKTGCYDGR